MDSKYKKNRRGMKFECFFHRFVAITIIISLIFIQISVGNNVKAEGEGTPHSGSTSGDETWTKATSPHKITDDFTVSNGDKLTIEPGVDVLFYADTNLEIDGTLIARGTDNELITFTAYVEVGAPQAGHWGSIQFNDISDDIDTELYDCNINYSTTGIKLLSSSPHLVNMNISNSVNGVFLSESEASFFFNNNFSNNQNIGINIDDSSPLIDSCNVSSNDCGIYVTGSSSPEIKRNVIVDNPEGIYLSDCAIPRVYKNIFYYNEISIKIEDNDPIIVENEIHKSIDIGIENIRSSPDIRANKIIDSDIGIKNSDYSDPYIKSNTINNNDEAGILVITNSEPYIIGNNIDSNYYGIKCDSTSPSIVENKITENEIYDLYLNGNSDPYLYGVIFDTKNINMADIVPCDMSYSETTLEDGEEVTVYVYVKNSGDTSVSNVLVKFYNAIEDSSSPPYDYQQIGITKYVTLNPEQSTQLDVSTTVDGGMNLFKVSVDVNDDYYESDENNDLIGEQIPVATLVKYDWTVTTDETYEGEIIFSNNLVINSGILTLDAGMLKIDNTEEENGENGITINTDGTLIIENQYIITSMQPDEYYYYFDVHGTLNILEHSQILYTYEGIHLYSDVDEDTSIISSYIYNGLNSGIYFDEVPVILEIRENEIFDNQIGYKFDDSVAMLENEYITYNDYGIISDGESIIEVINSTIWDNSEYDIKDDGGILKLFDTEFDPDNTDVSLDPSDPDTYIEIFRGEHIEIYDQYDIKIYNVHVIVTQDDITIYDGNTGNNGQIRFLYIRQWVIDEVEQYLDEYEITTPEEPPGTYPEEGFITTLKGEEKFIQGFAHHATTILIGKIYIESRNGYYDVYLDDFIILTEGGYTSDTGFVTLQIEISWDEEGGKKEKWKFGMTVLECYGKNNEKAPSTWPREDGPFSMRIAEDTQGKGAADYYERYDKWGSHDDGKKYLQVTLEAHAVQLYQFYTWGKWYKGGWVFGKCDLKRFNETWDPILVRDEIRPSWNPFKMGNMEGDGLGYKAESEYPTKMSARLFYAPEPPLYLMNLWVTTGLTPGNYEMKVWYRDFYNGGWLLVGLVTATGGVDADLQYPANCYGRWIEIYVLNTLFKKIPWPFNEWRCDFSVSLGGVGRKEATAYVFSDDGRWG